MNRKGYLLPMSVIYLIIAVILGIGIFYLGGLERIGAKRRLNREKAFYVAEAGAYWAFSYLKDGVNKDGESQSFEGGTFSVEIEDIEYEADGKEITSLGTVSGATEKVKLVAGYRNVWSQGIFGSDVVAIGNSVIDGYDSNDSPPYEISADEPNADVGSKEFINMDNPNATIYGNASVSTDTPPAGGTITGERNSNHDFGDPLDNLSDYPVVLPNYSPPSAGDITGPFTLVNGVLTVKTMGKKDPPATIGSGSYRFNEIVFENDSELVLEGVVNLYVRDRFDMSVNKAVFTMQGETVLYLGENSTMYTYPSQHVQINTYQNNPLNFRIYSASTRPADDGDDPSIAINNNRGLVALIYCPLGKVDIKNGAAIYGGIVSDGIEIGNSSSILYDVNLRNMDIPDDTARGPLRILRWTKPTWVRFQ